MQIKITKELITDFTQTAVNLTDLLNQAQIIFILNILYKLQNSFEMYSLLFINYWVKIVYILYYVGLWNSTLLKWES